MINNLIPNKIEICRRIFFLLAVLSLPIAFFAQPRSVNRTTSAMPEETKAQQIMRKAKTGKPYDATRNFLAGDNLYSYIGQELYVIPQVVTQSKLFGKNEGSYSGFLPSSITEYSSGDFVHYNAYKSGLGRADTPAKYLARRTFVVDRICQIEEDPNEFIFFMHDKKTSEHVNYLYNIKAVDKSDAHGFWSFPDFPFLTLSHFTYLQKKYIGKPLIVSAHPFRANQEGAHKFAPKDINTGESIQLPKADYYQFKVEDIVLDESKGELCYQLTDGTHHFYQSMMMSYDEPSHSGRASRIFLKSDWDKLVNKYGKADMEAVLCSEITENMDSALVFITYGNATSFDKFDGGYYVTYCYPDETIVFDENWRVRGRMFGKCSDVKKEIITKVFVVATTYKVVDTVGRIISAPFKIVKKFIDFFGI